VALKRILRELKTLRLMRHDNVIELKSVYFGGFSVAEPGDMDDITYAENVTLQFLVLLF
jgi:hypothetical protein